MEPLEPSNGEVIEKVSETVNASNENAAYIFNAIRDTRTDLVERINTSDKRTQEVFAAHELRDQERFTDINDSIGALTTEVQSTNGGLDTVKGKVELIEDREDQT